jgi:aspartokinase-like uncharacterized kinase
MPSSSGLTVVKVGGSLYDLPHLGQRLRAYFNRLEGAVVIVPGGGATADSVRSLDKWQNLGEDISHALALESLSLNASFLAQIIPDSVRVRELNALHDIWQQGKIPVFDPREFALADPELPHSWEVTSDSIAARLAVVAEARRLILLKSTTMPEPIDWVEAGRRGLVDPFFGKVLSQSPTLQVDVVNLRAS